MEKIQDLLDKVAESGVGFYALKSYTIVIKDTNGNTLSIGSISVVEDKKQVVIKLEDE